MIGKIKAVTDPNQQRTEFQYDSLGRPVLTKMTAGGSITYEYVNWGNPGSQRVRATVSDGSADRLWSETYVDGLGRPYRRTSGGGASRRTFSRETVYADATSLMPIFYSSSGTETLKPAEHRKSNDKRCKSVVPR